MLDVVKYASTRGIRTTIGSGGTLINERTGRKVIEVLKYLEEEVWHK